MSTNIDALLEQARVSLGLMLSYHGQGNADYAYVAQVKAQEAYDAIDDAIAASTAPAGAQAEPKVVQEIGRLYALIEAVRLMRRGQREYWKRNFSPEESMALEAAEEEVDRLLAAEQAEPKAG